MCKEYQYINFDQSSELRLSGLKRFKKILFQIWMAHFTLIFLSKAIISGIIKRATEVSIIYYGNDSV